MKKYWKLIQQHLGVDADGIPGPKTALALLDRLGIRQPEQSFRGSQQPAFSRKTQVLYNNGRSHHILHPSEFSDGYG